LKAPGEIGEKVIRAHFELSGFLRRNFLGFFLDLAALLTKKYDENIDEIFIEMNFYFEVVCCDDRN
jgi:hypothetical protein